MTAFDYILDKLLMSEDLTEEQAETAMREIMSGTVDKCKIAAFLAVLRMKGETPAEIAGFALTMRKFAKVIKCEVPDAVDIVGTGGDGLHTINISTTAAFVAAGAGVTVAKHGNRAVSSRSGSADVLTALGINVNLTPAQMEECLKRTGMAFLYAPLLHPAMRFVMPVRQQLGIRTVFNILGPLCNPAGIKRYVMGVYDNKLCWKMAEACKGLGFDHSLIVHGEEGLDELSITGPSYICELKDKNVLEYKLGPEELGFELGRLSDLRGGTPEKNARIIKSILNGQSTSGAKYDVVLLNAAAAIYIGAKADCWEYAIEKARESIESGSAYKKYREFAEFTQAL